MDRISDESRLIAKNTVLLYLRMCVMLVIGLFTSRVVLKSLGVSDFGVYNAVGGAVTVFTFLTSSIASAISRYMAFEIGRADTEKLRKVFSTSIIIQIAAAVVIAVLVETVGMWLLQTKMEIPQGRMDAAAFTLHCSLGVLVINLMAVPFNALIIAHERMGAYAYISILEAVLKITVAVMLLQSEGDRLMMYAALMVAVALIVRVTYGIYCHTRFEESRGRLQWDASLVREMSAFAGWSFLGSSAYVFNTQGIGIVLNLFFGVIANAARGIALQVEGIARQFTNNILTAFNPRMTKSWAAGDKEYCWHLAAKASKYVGLVMLLFIVPFAFEAESLIYLWLGQVPQYSADFVRLTLLCLLLNAVVNPLHTLQQATGRIRTYYLITGLTAYTAIPVAYLAFRLGASPYAAYFVLIGIYLADCIEKIVILHVQAGLPAGKFLKEGPLKVLLTGICAALASLIPYILMPQGIARGITLSLTAIAAACAGAWMLALTPGEKEFIKGRLPRKKSSN